MLVHWARRLCERKSTSVLRRHVDGYRGGRPLSISSAAGQIDAIVFVPVWAIWLCLPVAFFIGVPIAIVLRSGRRCLSPQAASPLSIVAQRAYAGIDNPAFSCHTGLHADRGTHAGYWHVGRPSRAVTSALVGRIRGGLPVGGRPGGQRAVR